MDVAPALYLSDVRFAYPRHAPVIDIPKFEIAQGERVFLHGPSGSGKSTLLGLVAGTLAADHGETIVLGTDLGTLSEAERDRYRADHLGMIFQLFNLIPYLSVLENVTLPVRFSPKRRARCDEAGGVNQAARGLLGRLGLDAPDLLKRRVADLSVGQQQRVATARALIGAPGLIIADEPTSALDADTRDAFLDVLADQVAASNAALLFVSHDRALAGHFDTEVGLDDINRAAPQGVAA